MSATELEIKLQIPDEALPAVRSRMAGASAVRTRMQAIYFDTEQGDLGRAGVALRLRREGSHWVQTLKASRGDGDAFERHEHNVPRAGAAEPALDVSLHSGTPAGDALVQALSGAAGPGAAPPDLRELFRTDIQRTHRLHRLKGGCVEMALDEGVIRCGHLTWPVQELEIEHKSGRRGVVPEAASQWVQRHGLWLDTRSKAERGHRLWQARIGQAVMPDDARVSRAVSASEAFKAAPVCLHAAGAAADVALQAGLLKPLLPALLANASELAGGTGTEEHIHQLRVSIRRLRSVVRLGDRWMPAWPEPVMSCIIGLFRTLGAQRDRDVVEREWGPALQRAGCPMQGVPPRGEAFTPPDLVQALRARELNWAWLWLLRAAGDHGSTVPVSALVAGLHERLERWAAEISQQAVRFERLDEPAQHDLRKRIKRLRYALDSTALLDLSGPLKPRREYTEALALAQTVMGQYCDLLTARDVWRQACEQDAQAWFAVGWISAEIGRMKPDVAKTLRRHGRIDKRWRAAA